MNSQERMALAMQHQTPDRVPVMCQLALGHYFLNMKDIWKPHQIWFTSEAFADSLVTLARRYRFDGILINIPGRDPLIVESRRSTDIIQKTDLERVVMNELMMRLSMEDVRVVGKAASVPPKFTEQKRDPVVEETVPLGLRGYVQRYFEGLAAE